MNDDFIACIHVEDTYTATEQKLIKFNKWSLCIKVKYGRINNLIRKDMKDMKSFNMTDNRHNQKHT